MRGAGEVDLVLGGEEALVFLLLAGERAMSLPLAEVEYLAKRVCWWEVLLGLSRTTFL